ncbi:MAG: hypothetical protein ABJE99_10700 [Roseobacter sp.]
MAPQQPGLGPFAQSGEFNGFFNVKYASHYDLAGRIRHQGDENLTIVSAKLSEDGQSIQLDLRR